MRKGEEEDEEEGRVEEEENEEEDIRGILERSTVEPELLNPIIPEGRLKDALLKLSTEANEFYLNSQVPVLSSPPSPSVFFREWVSTNRPAVIKGVAGDWLALHKWTNDYLRDALGHKNITVAVTPNGYADAPLNGYFVMPEERTMKFGAFLDVMEHPNTQQGVFYIQKQNSNLTEEFPELLPDVTPEVTWFSEALGKTPDAANFWMGDGRAVTSMHKDNYENLYCVIRGHKDFILLPPTDLPWIPYRSYPPAVYHQVDHHNHHRQSTENQQNQAAENLDRPTEGEESHQIQSSEFRSERRGDQNEGMRGAGNEREREIVENEDQRESQTAIKSGNEKENGIEREDRRCDVTRTDGFTVRQTHERPVPWICIDPERPDLATYPQFAHTSPVRVRIRAGEALYLPSLWYHHVRQSHGCIAVNYWYDMDYGPKFVYHRLLQGLAWVKEPDG